eukprot:TRINITY_DN15065_c0_g1_i1.p1 TRINITY_DN15065_c0_g1~~TRINITY_DN15065_c0_g1_i1.p1  ORF type:complete len:637 (-),score=55.12 TRINITY_DN15065_c0_g1_i1:456-2366(-)
MSSSPEPQSALESLQPPRLSLLDLPIEVSRVIFRFSPYNILSKCACANKFLAQEVWLSVTHFDQQRETEDLTFDDDEDLEDDAPGFTFPSLRKCCNLQRLWLENWRSSGLTPSELPLLFTNLVSLISPIYFGENISALNHLTKLTKLVTEGIPNDVSLASLTRLVHLDILDDRLSPQIFQNLCSFNKLRKLGLGTILGGKDLEAICSHPTLEKVYQPEYVFSWEDSDYEVISRAQKPPLFVDQEGRTYYGQLIRRYQKSKDEPTEPTNAQLEIALRRWKQFPSTTTDPNTRDSHGFAAIHMALKYLCTPDDIQMLLSAGADANALMPQGRLPTTRFFFASLTPTSKTDSYILPVSHALATRAPQQICTALWNATKDIHAGAVSPLLASLMSATSRITRFAIQNCSSDSFDVFRPLYVRDGDRIATTNLLFEAILHEAGPAAELLLSLVSDEVLEQHAEEISRFFHSPPQNTAVSPIHRLFLNTSKRSLPNGSSWGPPDKRNFKSYAHNVVFRLLKYVKDPWIPDTSGWFPLDGWLAHRYAPYLEEFHIPAHAFWTQFRKTHYSPIKAFLRERPDPTSLLRTLYEDALSRGGAAALAKMIATLFYKSNPLHMVYLLMGCPGNFRKQFQHPSMDHVLA